MYIHQDLAKILSVVFVLSVIANYDPQFLPSNRIWAHIIKCWTALLLAVLSIYFWNMMYELLLKM